MPQSNLVQRDIFKLEIKESDPTQDQLKILLEYGVKPSELVKGATSSADVHEKIKENADAFIRQVVVDWSSGKAVAGDNESAILSLLTISPIVNLAISCASGPSSNFKL